MFNNHLCLRYTYIPILPNKNNMRQKKNFAFSGVEVYFVSILSLQDWIYRQICRCTTPIHPLLPPLIEVYIQSIILPSTKTDRTNEPIRNEEILAVFKEGSFTKHSKEQGTTPKRSTGKSPERSAKDSSKTEKAKKGKDSSKKKKSGEASRTLLSESEHAGMASKLLLMYYVLLYQETYIANIKIIGKRSFPFLWNNVALPHIDLWYTTILTN